MAIVEEHPDEGTKQLEVPREQASGEETEKQSKGTEKEDSSVEEAKTEEGTETLSENFAESIAGLEIRTGLENRTESSAEGDESDEEYDYEDDVWRGGGLRGFLQKVDEPWKISRQYFPSKAGGAPAWLDPVNIPKGNHMICGICDKPLQFVLQVYAPAEDDPAAFHRTLFVFMCTSLACLQQDEIQQRRKEKRRRSVKVFRNQLSRENSYYSANPPRSDGKESALCDGPALCTLCGTWRGDKVCGGCKQTRYCSQSHQMDHWRGEHAPYCRRVQHLLKIGALESVVQPREAGTVGGHLWPEFELIVDETVAEESDDSDDNVTSRHSAGRLLADYERRRRQGNDFSSKDVQDVQEASLEEQHWVFFQAKVSKSPEQVLWYHRTAEAKPLWPRLSGQPKKSDIPPCVLCGGDRTFEFQILPQLLYFFDVKDDPDSLDFGTIAVYTCANSCCIPGYCEEFAWVQPGFT